MSDFTSGFWSAYIIAIVVAGLVGCAWLLFSTGRIRVSATKKTVDGARPTVAVTGHVWDGDLQEYNHPLPGWWANLFWITLVFAVGYLVLYPGLGAIPGLLGWTASGAYAAERAESDGRLKPLYAKYEQMEVGEIAKDGAARQTGERLFLTYCAQCHGSDAGGARGFPNLRDADWLYGGAPANIIETVSGGRMGVMPAFGGTLGDDGVKNVAAHVRSLSGLIHDGLRAQLGKPLFAQNCAACHGADGKGNQAMGAPNLTDTIWLYGSTEAAIAEGILNGRNVSASSGVKAMPSFEGVLTPAQIRVVAAYVWGLSHNAQSAK